MCWIRLQAKCSYDDIGDQLKAIIMKETITNAIILLDLSTTFIVDIQRLLRKDKRVVWSLKMVRRNRANCDKASMHCNK